MTCHCDPYNLYLCCPHSIFVESRIGRIDLSLLSQRLGRVHGVGRGRNRGGALEYH